MFRLSELVSSIFVSKNNPSHLAKDIIRECKGAVVRQQNWRKGK